MSTCFVFSPCKGGLCDLFCSAPSHTFNVILSTEHFQLLEAVLKGLFGFLTDARSLFPETQWSCAIAGPGPMSVSQLFSGFTTVYTP